MVENRPHIKPIFKDETLYSDFLMYIDEYDKAVEEYREKLHATNICTTRIEINLAYSKDSGRTQEDRDKALKQVHRFSYSLQRKRDALKCANENRILKRERLMEKYHEAISRIPKIPT